jgi:hypothetical protein
MPPTTVSLSFVSIAPSLTWKRITYASLSDDWGVGIAQEWTASNLDIVSVSHGRFWCDYVLKKEKTATYRREPGKRGPAKCPDIGGRERRSPHGEVRHGDVAIALTEETECGDHLKLQEERALGKRD